jgi:hypothetical protein
MSHLLNNLLRDLRDHDCAEGAILTRGFLFPSVLVTPLPLGTDAAGPAGRPNQSAFPALI